MSWFQICVFCESRLVRCHFRKRAPVSHLTLSHTVETEATGKNGFVELAVGMTALMNIVRTDCAVKNEKWESRPH